MHWADKLAKKIIDSGKYAPFWVDDMKTPSGFAHIGSMLGPIIHSCIYRALKDAGHEAKLTYVFNDFDVADEFPEIFREHLKGNEGKVLKTIPSPSPEFSNFADFIASDLKKSLEFLGFEAEYISSWDLYHQGKFDEVIKTALDNSEKIQDIYEKISGSKKKDAGWLPFQVICEKCDKLGTTKVYAWDGKKVSYRCEHDLVKWAKGCGHEGKISPFGGTGKLPWKVDWAAHWKVLDITVEGAGKDHASAGGSYDIALTLLDEVFKKEKPYHFGYEFLLIGGRKMSSSKGIGLKAHDLVKILPSEVARFLFVNNDIFAQGSFDPAGTMAIPDLFDNYDACWKAYNANSDENLSRVFVLSQTGKTPEKSDSLFLPRFRDVANYLQLPNVKLESKFEEIKGSKLTDIERDLLDQRVKYAQIWLENYAPDEVRFQMSDIPFEEIKISDKDWEFLNKLSIIWKKIEDPESLQGEIFKLVKGGYDMKSSFKALYRVLINKDFGPRAGWLLKKFSINDVVQRFTLNNQTKTKKSGKSSVSNFEKPEYFVIDNELKNKFPSVSVGIALIKNVNIVKTNSELEKEKEELLSDLTGLTTEKLGIYDEVSAYRKLYKETGIDWHSRRPSPEALLRRVALGKGLYTINTCVDAYNLIVMKHLVSVGAFDANKLEFPTVLRFANEGEEILLLGDEKPTKYKSGEIAYFDQIGGYNMDFNYRDSQRTMVTENTKNVWINVDGVYDVTPEKVQKSLNESVEKIIKYCGGTLDFKGVVR